MSLQKNSNITQSELNGIISVFKHFHQDKDIIQDPYGVNECQYSTFEFINSIPTNEELIFENEIICNINKHTPINLGEHYQIRADYYEYDLDNDPNTYPVLKSKIFDLSPVGDNKYKCVLDSPVIYMQPSNIILITRYDGKIKVPR